MDDILSRFSINCHSSIRYAGAMTVWFARICPAAGLVTKSMRLLAQAYLRSKKKLSPI